MYSASLVDLSRNVLVTYARPPLVMSHGKGCLVYDSEGREYLDLTAGIAVNSLGHADEGGKPSCRSVQARLRC